ncbi:MAG: glycosyltransferase [Geminicoccaceae bacterium]
MLKALVRLLPFKDHVRSALERLSRYVPALEALIWPTAGGPIRWQDHDLGRDPPALARRSPPIVADVSGSKQPCPGPIYYSVGQTLSIPFNSGIQRVVRLLAAALIDQGCELIPAVWDRRRGRLLPAPKDRLGHLARWHGPSEQSWAAWREPEAIGGRAWFLSAEVWHDAPGRDLPELARFLRETGLRSAWIFHDAIPWALPGIHSRALVEAHTSYMEGLARFDHILAVSHSSRSDLLAFYERSGRGAELRADQVWTVPLSGAFPGTDRVTTPPPRRPESEPVQPLVVGTLESRKNHKTLLDAVGELANHCRRPFEVTLIGRAESQQRLIRSRIKTLPQVSWLPSVDDDALRRRYSACDFTVFPSVKEGFGLPIVESLWFGRPCICAHWGAMAEVAGSGGCLTTDVTDPRALAGAMRTLIEDQDRRLELAMEAVRLQPRSWSDYARDVAWCLTEVDVGAAAER